MTVRHVPLRYGWQHVRIENDRIGRARYLVERRLKDVLHSWRGTRYMDGQCVKGAGVDCVRFLACVLNELYREELAVPERLPRDLSLHDPAGARAALRRFMETYPHDDVTDAPALTPGDVLVTGPVDGGPGHAVLVGPVRNTLWEATTQGVDQTGWARPSTERVFRAFRLRERELWI